MFVSDGDGVCVCLLHDDQIVCSGANDEDVEVPYVLYAYRA